MFLLLYYFNSYFENLFTGEDKTLNNDKESKYSIIE